MCYLIVHTNDSDAGDQSLCILDASINDTLHERLKNTVQMSDLLVELFCEWQISRKFWIDSNIVTGRFSSASVKPPRNFHVQMNDLDAGYSSRCD